MSSSAVTYAPERTLTVSTELIRQMRRRRTVVAMLLAVALPLVVVAAVKFGPQSEGGGGFGDGDLDSLEAGGRGDHLEILRLQLGAEQTDIGFKVVDYQNPRRHRALRQSRKRRTVSMKVETVIGLEI